MTQFSDAVLASVPDIYYQCDDEPGGTDIADSSGGNHNGTLSGAYTKKAQDGISGSHAIAFSGGMISLPYFSALTFSADYTLEFVLKITSSPIGYLLSLTEGAPSTLGPAIAVNYDQSLAANIVGAITFRDKRDVKYAVVASSSTDKYNDGLFRHFVFIRRGLSLEIWVNGRLVASKTIPDITVYGANVMEVMNHGGTGVNGSLGEFALYGRRALSPNEIAMHASFVSGLSSISGSARLDDGTAARAVVLRDWSTRANIAEAVPASDGKFAFVTVPGTYDVTVFGPAGYQPITHGPITTVESA